MSFLEDYQINRDRFDDFKAHMKRRLESLVLDAKVPFALIDGRVKSFESVKEKLDRPEKAGKYKNLDDMTDLIGLRVVIYDKDDIARMGSLIRDHFIVDAANSVNKKDNLDPKEFGYMSVHFVVSCLPTSPNTRAWEDFLGLKAEIQIRTLLQHMWAATDHDLYKQKSVPWELERTMSQLAAVLELADDLFASVKGTRRLAEKETTKQIQTSPQTVSIDEYSLNLLMGETEFTQVFKSAERAGFSTCQASDQQSQHYRTGIAKLCERLPLKTIHDLRTKLTDTAHWRDEFFTRLHTGCAWVVTLPFTVLLILAAAFEGAPVTSEMLVELSFRKEMAERVLRAARETKSRPVT